LWLGELIGACLEDRLDTVDVGYRIVDAARGPLTALAASALVLNASQPPVVAVFDGS
jgi:hypothetical protein